MSEIRDESVENLNSAVKILNGLIEIKDIDLTTLHTGNSSASAYTLISIAQNLDRIATALESKE